MALRFSLHTYEVRPRKDKRGFDLISDALPFGRLWYGEPNVVTNAIGYTMQQLTRSRNSDRLSWRFCSAHGNDKVM